MFPRKLDAAVKFGPYECVAYETRYPSGAGQGPSAGSKAIYLVDAHDGETVATATVNVEGVSERLPASEVLIKDYSENAGMLDALVGAGLVEDTGRRVPTGYVTVPVARLLYDAEDDAEKTDGKEA